MVNYKAIERVAYRTVLLVAALVLIFLAFQQLITLAVAVVATVLVAILLDSAASRLEKRNIPRPLGALIALLAGVAIFAALLVLIIPLVGSAWALRAMGLQYRLQRGAFEARSEWVLRMPPYNTPPVPASEARLTPKMLDEALHRGRTNPYLLWPPYARLWGEN